jgi:hypothetical protein
MFCACAVWPSVRTRLFSSFPSRADLIAAVLASCHLPSLSDGSFTVNFKGRLHIDGGLLSVVTPPPDAAHTVLVCRCAHYAIVCISFLHRSSRPSHQPKGKPLLIRFWLQTFWWRAWVFLHCAWRRAQIHVSRVLKRGKTLTRWQLHGELQEPAAH